jgi:hypothetical protein
MATSLNQGLSELDKKTKKLEEDVRSSIDKFNQDPISAGISAELGKRSLDGRLEVNLEGTHGSDRAEDDVYTGSLGNLKNRFSTATGDQNEGGVSDKSVPETISPEVEEHFKKAEAKHGARPSSLEMKSVVMKLLRKEQIMFVYANLLSDYHIIFEVLDLAGLRLSILFLYEPMIGLIKPVLPASVKLLTLGSLSLFPHNDVLFVLNSELGEDLSLIERRNYKLFLTNSPGTKVLMTDSMTIRSFTTLKEEIGGPFYTGMLRGLKVILFAN